MLNLDYPKPPSFFLIHGVSLWTIWTIFSLIQVISNRYMKHHWQTHMWVHRFTGTFIIMTTLFYGFYGWWKMGKIKNDWHAPLGVFVTCIVFFLAVTGMNAGR